MVIKYRYSGLLLLEALLSPIPIFLFIWFFFGHKGVDAAHPFMLIFALSIILHIVLFCLFKLFVACQKLWEKDYLSIKGDHICFYDCLRRKYTEVLLSGKNKLKALYPFTHRCCSRFTYPGAWFSVLNCKHYKMCLF